VAALVAIHSTGLAGTDGAFDVQILDARTGEPIPGAVVTVYDQVNAAGARIADRPPDGDASLFRTDDGGHARLAGGRWPLVHVRAEGYVARWWDWTSFVDASRGAPVRLELDHGTVRTFTIRDAWGAPVKRARVSVYEPGAFRWPSATVIADERGRCEVRVVADSALLFCAIGLATREMNDPLQHPATVTLLPEARVSGIVRDERNSPVPGATLVIAETLGNHGTTTTDANGRFEYGALTPGQAAQIDVEASGFANASVLVRSNDEQVSIVLRALRTVSGVVHDAQGKPVVGATVRFPGGDARATDADGRFRVEGAPLDPFYLEVTAGPRGLAATVPVPPETERVEIVARPFPASYARVRLVDPDAEPDRRPPLVLGAGTTRWLPGGCLQVLSHEPPGTEVDLQVERALEWSPIRIRTQAKEDCDEQVVPLPAFPRATVVVRLPDGSPLPGEIVADIRCRSWPYREVKAERAHDRATFLLSPGDAVSLAVEAPGYPRVRTDAPLAGDGAPLVVRLADPVTLRGRVVDEQGEPAGRCWVKGIGTRDGGIAGTWTDLENGSFELGPLANEEVMLFAGRECEVAQAMLRWKPGSPDVGTLPLEPLRTVEGRVVGPKGEPLAGVEIRVLGANGQWFYPPTATRGDGDFAIRVARSEHGNVLALKPGYGAQAAPLDDEPLVLRLPRAGTLLLRRAAGTSAPDVAASPAGGDWSWEPRGDDVDGPATRYEGLPPGPLELTIRDAAGDEHTLRVTIVAGETVEADTEPR